MAALPGIAELTSGRKAAVAQVLAALESGTMTGELAQLLDQAHDVPRGHVIGITGPPGVGKSSLIGALLKRWRAEDLSVGILAVDPSSRRSGGALLGDRIRIVTDPRDGQVFMRSVAARTRLGGLADSSFPAAVLMRAVYDRVVIETVGVGQSETDVADVADTVLFCVQPASGDSLQFMKAGIMEVPHVAVVTKADMGTVAERARADVEGAIGLAVAADDWQVRVLTVSTQSGQGLGELADELHRHFGWLRTSGHLEARRAAQSARFTEEAVRDRFGREGLTRVQDMYPDALTPRGAPFGPLHEVNRELLKLWSGT